MLIFLGTFKMEFPNCQIMNLATLGAHKLFHFAFKSRALKGKHVAFEKKFL
jgi:hypothetical protein